MSNRPICIDYRLLYVFTMRRYASAVYAVNVCVCLSVCLSVTLRYCIKTAKRSISQITPTIAHA